MERAKTILLMILLIPAAVLVAGCSGNDKISPVYDTSTAVPEYTMTPSPAPTAMIFTVTPLPGMVYPRANSSPVEHVITPDASFKKSYSESEYPRIVDNGNGTVDVILYFKSTSRQTVPMIFKNEPLIYSIIPTEDSKRVEGPAVVYGMGVDDNINGFLHAGIWPLPDGTGNVSITAATSLGNYSFNGTMMKPLEMQPVLCSIGEGMMVENNRLRFDAGHYWDLRPVRARNQTFYVIGNKYPDTPALPVPFWS